jgi:predicted N-acyltransferase
VAYRDAGYFLRHSFQFHWANHGYRDFAEFLAALRSKRRKEIQRERGQVNEAGIRIERLTGDLLKGSHGALFYEFYLHTIDRKGGYDYLTKDFFVKCFERMKDKILLVLAFSGEKAVAAALYFYGENILFGRNWGASEEYRSLHFELCYYQGIEFAIERGFRKFEAGAQGEHKFNRGFLPTLTLSAHKILHPAFDRAIREYVEFEKQEIELAFAEYEAHSPEKEDP